MVTGLSLDYLRFTIPADLAAGLCCDQILRLLSLDALGLDVEHRRGGHLFWRCSAFIARGGIVAWGGNHDTACVDLSGGALAYLAAMGLDVLTWAAWCMARGCRVTRIDVALDDTGERLTKRRVLQAVRDGGAITRARSADIQQPLFGGSGWTMYFGARRSSVLVRIYDKAAQLKARGPWVRLEVEYKNRKAHAVALAWAAAGWTAGAAIGFIRDALDFRQPSATDSNCARWGLRSWWSDIVGQVERCRVLVGRLEDSIERVATWLASCASALAAVVEVKGERFLQQVLERGHANMSPRHSRMVVLALATSG